MDFGVPVAAGVPPTTAEPAVSGRSDNVFTSTFWKRATLGAGLLTALLSGAPQAMADGRFHLPYGDGLNAPSDSGSGRLRLYVCTLHATICQTPVRESRMSCTDSWAFAQPARRNSRDSRR